LRFNHHETAYDILGLSVRPIADRFRLSLDNLTGLLEWMPLFLDVSFRAQFLHPGHPFLQMLLHFLRRLGCISTAKQICEFTHCIFPLFYSLPLCRRLSGRSADIFWECMRQKAQ